MLSTLNISLPKGQRVLGAQQRPNHAGQGSSAGQWDHKHKADMYSGACGAGAGREEAGGTLSHEQCLVAGPGRERGQSKETGSHPATWQKRAGECPGSKHTGVRLRMGTSLPSLPSLLTWCCYICAMTSHQASCSAAALAPSRPASSPQGPALYHKPWEGAAAGPLGHWLTGWRRQFQLLRDFP